MAKGVLPGFPAQLVTTALVEGCGSTFERVNSATKPSPPDGVPISSRMPCKDPGNPRGRLPPRGPVFVQHCLFTAPYTACAGTDELICSTKSGKTRDSGGPLELYFLSFRPLLLPSAL